MGNYYKGYQNKIRWSCKYAALEWRKDHQGYNCLKSMLDGGTGAHYCHDCSDYKP